MAQEYLHIKSKEYHEISFIKRASINNNRYRIPTHADDTASNYSFHDEKNLFFASSYFLWPSWQRTGGSTNLPAARSRSWPLFWRLFSAPEKGRHQKRTMRRNYKYYFYFFIFFGWPKLHCCSFRWKKSLHCFFTLSFLLFSCLIFLEIIKHVHIKHNIRITYWR